MSGESDLDAIRDACKRSIWWYATHLVKTRSPQAANPIRPFPAYPYLRTILEDSLTHKIVGVQKARQLLLTWAACVLVTWECAFHEYKHDMIQSEKEEKAKYVLGRAEFILSQLPPGLVEYKATSNRIDFANGSVIHCVPQGPQQIATYDPSRVIMDEMALQDDAREAYYTMIPALRAGGSLVGISSPRGETFFEEFMTEIPAVHKITVRVEDNPEYVERAAALGGWPAFHAAFARELGYPDNEEGRAMYEREMKLSYDAVGGVPAFRPPFARETHVASRQLVANPCLPIQRGWDFGFHRPACVWTQVAANGQWLVLRELLGEDVPLADFVGEALAVSKEILPHPMPSQWEDFCDPSGWSKRDAGPASVEILREHDIHPLSGAKKIPVVPSINLVRRNLALVYVRNPETGLRELRPGTLVDPRCALLIRALNGAYCSSDRDKDTFFGGKTAHVVDGLRYIAAGKFHLGDEAWQKAS